MLSFCWNLDIVGWKKTQDRRLFLAAHSSCGTVAGTHLLSCSGHVPISQAPGALFPRKEAIRSRAGKASSLFQYALAGNSGHSPCLCLALGFVLSREPYAATQTLGCSPPRSVTWRRRQARRAEPWAGGFGLRGWQAAVPMPPPALGSHVIHSRVVHGHASWPILLCKSTACVCPGGSRATHPPIPVGPVL